MIAYNQAASPDFEKVSLTALFEHHQWLMEKIMEGEWALHTVYKYLKADFEMRTKWMLSWKRKERSTFAEVITHHRGQTAYLFSDIGGSRRVRRSCSGGRRSNDRSSQGATDQRGAAPVPEWKGLERSNKNGKKRCTFYNKKTGCRLGRECPDLHECDFPGCGATHSRADRHPIKPN